MNKFIRKNKELIYILILSITISFMLFIVEPTILYAGNINDFWFDYYTIIPKLILFFIISSLIIFVFLSVFLIFSKKLRKTSLIEIPIIIIFTVFLITYIHGNFFSNNLPSFNGEPIVWASYMPEHIISIIICTIVLVTVIISSIKLKTAKLAKISSFITLTIFAMLFVSLLNTFITTDTLKEKEIMTYATSDQLNTYSNNRNFLILLVDAVDSELFYKNVHDLDLYEETFQDFTYFPDTVGAYNLTRDSIPFIFSGIWDHNETDFVTYSTNAYNESPLFNELKKQNYTMNFYDNDFVWRSRKALDFNNITSHSKDIDPISLLKQLVKYDSFKYLPYPLKKFSHSESIDFASTQSLNEAASFNWEDLAYYNFIKENEASLTNQSLFQFLHLEGAHVPFNLDENLNSINIENGTYAKKCIATLKVINAYLENLKNIKVYDKSTIIIMSDHGANNVANPNPILFIKGINEHHDFVSSEKPIWYPDLIDAYDQLLSDKPASEAFINVPNEHRDRYIIQIPFQHEEHMTEWVQTGKAWDASTLTKTGKEYNL